MAEQDIDELALEESGGKMSEKGLPDSKRVYLFYWGFDEPIWSGEDRAPVLLHAPEWISKNPVALSERSFP